MFSIFLFILFGDSGLFDLRWLKTENSRLIERNLKLEQENLLLYREIDRLKNDLKYIENIARHELGMIGKGEVVVKLNDPSGKSK
jgi:cell division protein FtsB